MAGKTRKGWRILAAVIMGIGCAVAVITGVRVAIDQHYDGRALPGTQVAGIDVAGLTAPQISDLLSGRLADMKVTFEYDGHTVDATAADAGVRVDVGKAAKAAVEAKRDTGLTKRYSSTDIENVSLDPSVDTDTLRAYLDKAFSAVTAHPVNAQVTVDAPSASFLVVPGTEGAMIDASTVDGKLMEQAANLAAMTVPVSVQPISPEVTSEQAQQVADQLNANLAKEYTLQVNGDTVEELDRAMVASWIQISPDGLTPTVDEEAVSKYINETVAPDVHKDPVQQVRVVTKTGEFVRYQAEGKAGRSVTDVPALAAAIGNAILSGDPTAIDVPVGEVPFTEKTVVQPDKLIVVDLASQTTTLYENDTEIASYSISSGRAGYETPRGTFYVRAHVRIQTMRGFNNDGTRYETPNVEWVTYFNGGIAFHAAYWHNNFGHPMSHGCINMRNEPAKFLYNWAEIGTKVVVQ